MSLVREVVRLSLEGKTCALIYLTSGLGTFHYFVFYIEFIIKILRFCGRPCFEPDFEINVLRL